MNRILLAFLLISSFCNGQDLIITGLSGTKTFGANDIFSGATTTIKNAGIIDVNADVYVKFYFSTDNVFDNQDLYVGSGFSQGLIKAGVSKPLPYYADAKQLTLPTGSYFLIATIDPYSSVNETDETNNTFVASGYTVTQSNFDFSFVSFGASSTFVALDTIPLVFEIQNPGKYTSVNRLFTSFYLSQDQILDANDAYCGKYSNWLDESLNGYAGYAYGDLVQVPNVTPGNYYLIAKIDAENRYTETDESNNIAISSLVTVNPSNIDLALNNLTVSLSGTDYLDMMVWVCNQGTTGAANIKVTSVDLIPKSGGFGGPVYFNQFSTLRLIGSECSWLYFSGIVFGSIPQDEYYVRVSVSYPTDNNIVNNEIISSNTLLIGTPQDISINSATFTGQYDANDLQFSGTTQYRNNGSYYYSGSVSFQLTIRNSANQVVYTQPLTDYVFIGSGSSYSSNWSISLNNPLALGDYTASLTCAEYNKCKSYSYNFNLSINQPLRNLSGRIQGEDGTPLTSGKLFLYQKNSNTGKISFTQKKDPVTSADFSFTIDGDRHTLYFIPDRASHPEYIPTIFGKTVILNNNNFFKISQDSTVVFEILKVQPPSSGGRTIEGNVYTGGGTNSSGRISGDQPHLDKLSSDNTYAVLLLDNNGNVVGITETDGEGNYSFANLANGVYKVLVMFELDKPQLMSAPIDVDVTQESKDLSFDFSGASMSVKTKTLQFIAFQVIPPVDYAHEDIELNALATSGLAVTFTSSNPAVAFISNGKIVIAGAGTTTLKARQSGNETFKFAEEVQELQIAKATAIVTAENKMRKFGEQNPPLTFGVTGLRAGESLNTSGISSPILSTSATVTSDVGAYPIQLTGGNGGNNYTIHFIEAQLTIEKADQIINFSTELQDISTETSTIDLEASSSSGLPVTFSITEGADIVGLVGSQLVLTGNAGVVTITATQGGSNNYNEASSVAKSFHVSLVMGVPEEQVQIDLFPNPTSGISKIKGSLKIKDIYLRDVLGKNLRSFLNVDASEFELNMSEYQQGVYQLFVVTENKKSITLKAIKTH